MDKTEEASVVSPRPRPLPYVLIAEEDVARVAWCLNAIRPFRLGTLVARDGEEAISILKRFGPPQLLVSDISLPRQDGFIVMELLRAMSGPRSAIIALTPFRELRSYAARRADLRISAIVSPTVDQEAFRDIVDRALQSIAGAPSADTGAAEAAAHLADVVRDAADEAARLAGTPGAAVYVRSPGDEQFRAHVSWTSHAAALASPFATPRIFEWIMETGETAVLPDLSDQPFGDSAASSFRDVVRGLVAVPVVTGANKPTGAISVFDVRPLTLGTGELDALRALGRWVGRFV